MMKTLNLKSFLQGITLVTALAAAVALMPASAFAQGANWKFQLDAENQTPDKLKVDAEGPGLSGTPATGGLAGSFLIEYGFPIDATLEFPIISSSVAGGVIVITGGTTGLAAAQALVTVNLNTGVASIADVAGAAGLPIGGSPRSWDSALNSLANPGDKLVVELTLDGSNLP